MQPTHNLPLWKQAPFIRLLFPLIAGILLQWYLGFSLGYIIICLICFSIALSFYYFLPVSLKYTFRFLQGLLIYFLLHLLPCCSPGKPIKANKKAGMAIL